VVDEVLLGVLEIFHNKTTRAAIITARLMVIEVALPVVAAVVVELGVVWVSM